MAADVVLTAANTLLRYLDGHTTDFFFVSMNRPLWEGMSTQERGIIIQAMKTASD